MFECFQYFGVIEQIYKCIEESVDGYVYVVGVIYQFFFVGFGFFWGSVVNIQLERNKNKNILIVCKCFGFFKLVFICILFLF